MALRVHVVCQNYKEDRIIPRMSRALGERLGWTVGAAPDPRADVIYLSGYFEGKRMRPWPGQPVAAYFTHREEQPAGNDKAKYFDEMAGRVQLRIATCKLYGEYLEQYGPTVQCAAPLERDRFTIAPKGRTPLAPLGRGERNGRGAKTMIGFSGYTYANHRKGEDLVRSLIESDISRDVIWRASGRGWPVPTVRYSWEQMPSFYQSLDILVVPSRVEGIPMPPLEALACGVKVVIPRGVGILDELPNMPGIYRYERGDAKSLYEAVQLAIDPYEQVDPEALRAVTEPYSVEAWCEDHRRAFEAAFEDDGAGMGDESQGDEGRTPLPPLSMGEREPERSNRFDPTGGTGSKRGIYCVAFGGPSRECARKLMLSIKQHMPDIPICLCAASPIGVEDVFIKQPDSDVGGRRAKLKAYELSPAEWEAVLYLDADTEVVAPIYQYFEWIEDGWEFVICKDPHLMDTLREFGRRNNHREMDELQREIRTLNAIQFNGGVWAFARNERVQAFFHRWKAEWERHAQRDQGALVRALFADPLKIWLLGNEWNTFPKYSRGVETAGLMHYPGDARRWSGLIPGRIDSVEAWERVKAYEARRRK